MTKYPEGSQGAAEAKENKIILIVFGVITLLVLGLMYVFNTDIKLFVKRAGFVPNLIGTVSVIGSWCVYFYAIVKEKDSTWAGIVWFLLLGLGLVCSGGFNFDYFGLK